MMKIIMVVVILMEETAVVKMLTQTFAPYANAQKKKLHCQMVNLYDYFKNCSVWTIDRIEGLL